MDESGSSSKLRSAVGASLLLIGVAAFAVRLLHAGDYAMPTGPGPLLGGVGGIVVGGLLLWSGMPRLLARVLLAVSPLVAFPGIYATMAELEETISLYATDSRGQPADLRLWIVDREDGAWVGMPQSKATEHSLDGARLEMLRDGETRCVVAVQTKDIETTRAIHRLKVEKYAVARAAALIGLYSREARPTTAALRLDPCRGA